MGLYRDAEQGLSSPARTRRPTSRRIETFGAVKYGFGLNAEQELTQNLRVFTRFGWNEGQHESFAYTEVDQTVRVRRRLLRPRVVSPQRQARRHLRLERHQEGSPGLSEAWRPRLSAGRRQPELRPRRHPRGLLQPARLARRLLRARPAVHQPPRLQPGSRPGAGRVRPHARRLLGLHPHPYFLRKVFER